MFDCSLRMERGLGDVVPGKTMTGNVCDTKAGYLYQKACQYSVSFC